MSEQPKDGIQDGLYAFPFVVGSQACVGMSLRDWFAGQALAGLLNQTHLVQKYRTDWFAAGAYRMADAMLAARGQA